MPDNGSTKKEGVGYKVVGLRRFRFMIRGARRSQGVIQGFCSLM